MRSALAVYLLFNVVLVGGFVVWAMCTHDHDDRITAWVTAASIGVLAAFATFLNTGSRRL